MRLREKEAYQRHQTHIVTMDDVARDRRAREAQARKDDERKRQAAKEAAKGPALLGMGGDHAE
ncbi:hypothetical protein [Geothrix campi]|uniref:hypothetical protein n=1 Tax=Geothrix campi TaxID=2966450 RepID=UPI0021496E4D|nr:hypothetical protein [Geothrix sp. SG10]